MRRPLGIVIAAAGGPLVLCEDGAVFRLETSLEGGEHWRELPALPGAARELELELLEQLQGTADDEAEHGELSASRASALRNWRSSYEQKLAAAGREARR